jgi:hypothetical protein
MTDYGRERERRRRQRSLLWLGYLLCATVILALRVGPVVALIGFACLGIAVYGLAVGLIWKSGRAESRRRAAGEPPSWFALLPVEAAVRMGGTVPGRHSRKPTGELPGRLVQLPDRLRWEPGKSLRDKGTQPISWDNTWSAEVIRLWGPGSQGCLTLTGGDGLAVDVWIREPRDLSRTLGLA